MRRGLLAAVAAVALLPGTAGAATGAPTVKTATTVAGVASPKPLADGSWSYAGGVWTGTFEATSVPGGSTVVESTWRSPKLRLRSARQWAFASSVQVENDAVQDGFTYSEAVRVCGAKRCQAWLGIGPYHVAPTIDPEQIPLFFVVTRGTALAGFSPKEPLWFEWRFRQVQVAAGRATTVIKVAAGAGVAGVMATD
jgi:hypothetical protein